MNLNYYIFQELNKFAGQYFWLDSLAIFFAKYLAYILAVFLLFLLIKNFKKYKEIIGKAFLAGVFARLIIVELIRFFFPIPRPFIENNINLILNHSATSSFPSGHASFFFALSTVIYFYNKKIGYLFFIASFLISISRVFVGIHWPIDILAGFIVGIFSALVIKIFINKIRS
ncbi:MAG TPA: phosphatase PAP2 family protein [bacterium]|nr:phosphatase PAP2 family protein [bacterium]